MSKFHAIRTIVDGITFASKKEAARYAELKLAERSGDIDSLILQPVFPIIINDKKVAKYIADFSYYIGQKHIIEDVKGVRTPVYKLKKKLVEAQYNIIITET